MPRFETARKYMLLNWSVVESISFNCVFVMMVIVTGE